MQRERLEGWMVKQIENADLAKETVLQLPSRVAAHPTSPRFSSDTGPSPSPRRSLPFGSTSPRRTQFSTLSSESENSSSNKHGGGSGATSPQGSGFSPQAPQSPRQRTTGGRKNSISPSAITSHKSLEPDASTGLEKQWRAHFCDPRQTFVEQNGRVDRTKVLKWSSNHHQPQHNDQQQQPPNESRMNLEMGLGDSASPLFLWGLPREHIVDYIRQSVLPSSWSMSTKFTGEWEAVSAEDEVGRAPSVQDSLAKALASLPPLSPTSSAPNSARKWSGSSNNNNSSSPRHSSGAQTARSPARRPHTSPFQTTQAAAMAASGNAGATLTSNSTNASPRITSPRSDDRITRIINELRADPGLWDAFVTKVKQFQEERRLKNKASDKIRENKERITSPQLATTTEERKKQAEERMERNRRQREHLVRQEELRLEARLAQYQQRFVVKKKQLTDQELANTVGFRRRKLWLTAVSFVLVAAKWRTRFTHMKQVVLLAKQQTRAAKTIQRLWRKWKWRHASRHTVVIYTWLRKCMWKLLFNVRCRRRARLAAILQRFMIDHFSGSRETRNFNCMMIKWRGKVIHSQRIGMNFVQCTRARLHALSLWWDHLDHERQRSERQQHERFLPTEEKEAEWATMLHSRKLAKRTSQRISINSSTTSLHASSSTVLSNNSNNSRASKSNAAATMSQLEHMDEKLTTMQQVLTPFEIQRLQQNAYHVVRIAKSIKMQLLQEYLTTARKEHMKRLTEFHEQRLCASFTREVRLDDARAIVQDSLSWGSLLSGDQRPTSSGANSGAKNNKKARLAQLKPTVELFAGERLRKRMDELLKRGVQLTLERDPDQRVVVERQQQQRLSMDLSSGLRPGSSKKRDPGPQNSSNTGTSCSSDGTSSSTSAVRKRQSSRHLAFLLPFKEAPQAKPTVLEDADADDE
ncbi:hypothetical protein Gpo141_00004707 [Globisporangium polare]